MLERIKVEFMTTDGCHLCEQAYEMVSYLIKTDSQVNDKVDLLKVEITNNDRLVDHYGIRIPVLVSSFGEIGWPFEIEELRLWLIQ